MGACGALSVWASEWEEGQDDASSGEKQEGWDRSVLSCLQWKGYKTGRNGELSGNATQSKMSPGVQKTRNYRVCQGKNTHTHTYTATIANTYLYFAIFHNLRESIGPHRVQCCLKKTIKRIDCGGTFLRLKSGYVQISSLQIQIRQITFMKFISPRWPDFSWVQYPSLGLSEASSSNSSPCL